MELKDSQDHVQHNADVAADTSIGVYAADMAWAKAQAEAKAKAKAGAGAKAKADADPGAKAKADAAAVAKAKADAAAVSKVVAVAVFVAILYLSKKDDLAYQTFGPTNWRKTGPAPMTDMRKRSDTYGRGNT